MASLDVAKIIARWIKYVASDANMFDKTEIMYSDMYNEATKQVTLTETCCKKCDCEPGQCVTNGDPAQKTNGDNANIALGHYNYKCGCVELCYSFNNQKVGRSKRTQCDGSVTENEYRLDIGQFI